MHAVTAHAHSICAVEIWLNIIVGFEGGTDQKQGRCTKRTQLLFPTKAALRGATADTSTQAMHATGRL